MARQTELRHRLRFQTFEAITQRVTMRYHLTGFSDLETKAYIQHHLKVAGVNHALFSDEAIRLIYQFSKGDTQADQQPLHGLSDRRLRG